jgi:hypothetical protein
MRKWIKTDPKIKTGRDSPLRNWVEDDLNEGELNGVMHAENLLQAGKKSGDPKETTLNLTVPALKKKHGEESYHHLMAGILSLTQMAGMRVLT